METDLGHTCMSVQLLVVLRSIRTERTAHPLSDTLVMEIQLFLYRAQ